VHARSREAAEITIEGLVQGVGFRDFTQRHAAALGLGGWVMNLPDGRVRVWAEGSRDAIESLVRHLERGPRRARVDRVAMAWREPSGGSPTFSIRSGYPER
jgi:acylphosphatase